MKKLTLVILSFLLAGVVLHGQDYRNIINDGTAFYSGSLTEPGSLCGVRADTAIATGGGDTLFLATNTYRPMTPPGDLLDTVGGILGRRIEKLNNGWFRFYTATGDTILLNTAAVLNDTWKFINLPQNNRLMATCTSILPETFLGVTDTVKTFTFQAKNSGGGNIYHYFNGKTIRLSRLYGLVKVYDMYRMPDTTSLYTLEGRTIPAIGFQGLTWHNINDLDTGDVFHYYWHECYYRLFHSEVLPGWRNHYLIRIVRSKTVIPGGNHVIYSYDYCDNVQEHDPLYGNSNYNRSGLETDTLNYSDSLATLSGSPVPNLFPNDRARDYATIPGIVPDVPSTGWNKGYYLCCYKPDPSYPGYLYRTEEEYARGLGTVHFYRPVLMVFSHEYRDLTFYKKGNKQWGTPFLFDWCGLVPPVGVSPSPVSVGWHAGDSAIIHVTAGGPWSIDTLGLRKFSFSRVSGTGNGDVTITALDSNVTGGSINSAYTISYSWNRVSFVVTQESKTLPFIESDPDTIVLAWEAGKSANLTIQTNVGWKLSCAAWPAWFSVSDTSGTSSKVVTFTSTGENDTIHSRKATIALESIAGNSDIVVMQESRYGVGTAEKTAAAVRISPNPLRETAMISVAGLPKNTEKQLTLYDFTGRKVWSDEFFSDTYIFNRGNLAPGMYLLKINYMGDTSSVLKVIIQ